jgi:uncharacterized protein YkwD
MTRPLTTLLLAIAVTALAPASALADCGAAAGRGPGASGSSPAAARSATLCLLNAERRTHGERRLRINRKLGRAAAQHARDMVRNHYFSHDTPSGQSFVQRIFKTNYVPAAASWGLGENLAWGRGAKATPRQIVRAWMASPDHRRNILTATFREIGIAVVVGAPVGGVNAAATYATEFGAIRRG